MKLQDCRHNTSQCYSLAFKKKKPTVKVHGSDALHALKTAPVGITLMFDCGFLSIKFNSQEKKCLKLNQYQ